MPWRDTPIGESTKLLAQRNAGVNQILLQSELDTRQKIVNKKTKKSLGIRNAWSEPNL
jgi:hypothetical protein